MLFRSGLEVEEAAGTLRLDLPAPWVQLTAGSQTLEVEQDGVRFPLDWLLNWGVRHGSSPWSGQRPLTFPQLPPGHYRACLGPLGWGDRIDAAAAQDEITCDEGTLTRGSELRLDLRR